MIYYGHRCFTQVYSFNTHNNEIVTIVIPIYQQNNRGLRVVHAYKVIELSGGESSDTNEPMQPGCRVNTLRQALLPTGNDGLPWSTGMGQFSELLSRAK